MAAWFPDAWVGAVDAHARVGAVTTRAALAAAAGTGVVAVLVRIGHGALRGLGRLLSPGRAHIRAAGLLGFVRWCAGVAFVALPWWRLMIIAQEGRDEPDLALLSQLCGVAWGLLLAADHRGAWLEGDEPLLVVRRGLAPFGTTTTRIRLPALLHHPGTDMPLGRIAGRGVQASLHASVWAELDRVLGREAALTWLTPLLQRAGVNLLPPQAKDPD